jgi:arsenate reductase
MAASKKRIVVYHNPRCSKSRQALELLRQRGHEPEIVEYLKAPPSANAVKELIELLGVAPQELLRKKEAPYAELGLGKEPSKADVAKAIAAHPVLLERPVVVVGKRAVIARPPERALELL